MDGRHCGILTPKLIYEPRHRVGVRDGRVYASRSPKPIYELTFTSATISARHGRRSGRIFRWVRYVIKEDPKNRDLVYLGTEFGLFASLNRGENWVRWPSLRTVAIYDLVIHPRDNDLILATHGRSFQVFDDISPVQQMNASVLASDSRLFDIRPATQFIPNESSWFKGGRDFLGANPAFGAYINYYLKASAKEDIKITITDAAGKVVRELTGPKEAGLNRVLWDLRTTPAGPSTIGFYFQTDITNLGAFVLPGEYRVKLRAQDQTKPSGSTPIRSCR
jgi:hypothetical protein